MISQILVYVVDYFLEQLASHHALFIYIFYPEHPEKVSISIKNHTGPMIEGNSYTLQCDVQNTGPLQLLTVNWNKVKGLRGNEDVINPRILANESTTLTISPSRNDTSYSCSAELRLGEKNPRIIQSNTLSITVHCK